MAFSTLTVDCQKIIENIKDIKAQSGNAKLLLVAKANCYGLGAEDVCKRVSSHVDFIGVETITAAITLRQASIKTPILLLSEPYKSDLNTIAANDISVTVHEKETIIEISKFVEQQKVPIKTHFKIDTGMTRLGSPWELASQTLNEWKKTSDYLIKEGVYSHFANSDIENHELNTIQMNRFKSIINDQTGLKHLANSNAITNISGSSFDLTRIGFKAYDNAFNITAPIRHLQNVKKGTSIGYGSTYISDEDCTVGVVGMGYADGLPSQLSNKGFVSIDNIPCKIIGKVCMDMFMIKYPKSLTPSVNQTVSIISDGTDNAMTILKASELADINPREIMVRFSNRVTRHYLN